MILSRNRKSLWRYQMSARATGRATSLPEHRVGAPLSIPCAPRDLGMQSPTLSIRGQS